MNFVFIGWQEICLFKLKFLLVCVIFEDLFNVEDCKVFVVFCVGGRLIFIDVKFVLVMDGKKNVLDYIVKVFCCEVCWSYL